MIYTYTIKATINPALKLWRNRGNSSFEGSYYPKAHCEIGMVVEAIIAFSYA